MNSETSEATGMLCGTYILQYCQMVIWQICSNRPGNEVPQSARLSEGGGECDRYLDNAQIEAAPLLMVLPLLSYAPHHHYQPSMREWKEREKSADDKLCLSRLKLRWNLMKQEQKKEKSLLIAQI